MKVSALLAALGFAAVSFSQSASQPSVQDDQPAKTEKAAKPRKGAAAEVGSGVGAAAGGVASGAASAATGVGKGALDLATLHPIDAGVAVGTGAAKAGKDVAVGSVKGVGRVGKGVGHALRKIL